MHCFCRDGSAGETVGCCPGRGSTIQKGSTIVENKIWTGEESKVCVVYVHVQNHGHMIITWQQSSTSEMWHQLLSSIPASPLSCHFPPFSSSSLVLLPFPRSLGWQQRNRFKASKDSLTRHSNSLHWMTVKMTLRRTQKIVSTMVKVVGAPQRQGREWLTLTPLYLFESHGANQVHPLLSVTESWKKNVISVQLIFLCYVCWV